jgi:hypothetical protein
MSVHLDSSSHGSFSTSLSRPSSKKYAVLTNEGQLKVSYRTVVVAQTKWESFCQFWRWVFRMGPLTPERLESKICPNRFEQESQRSMSSNLLQEQQQRVQN